MVLIGKKYKSRRAAESQRIYADQFGAEVVTTPAKARRRR